MALHWHLLSYLEDHDTTADALEALLPFPLPEAWLQEALPPGLGLDDLAVLCQALGCQPGELLTYTAETPEEIARRELERNMTYQSFLSFQEREAEDAP
ncbi:MAG: helix-turn-helix domain-containing protein [Candidatus Sericytochromatia bacterium]